MSALLSRKVLTFKFCSLYIGTVGVFEIKDVLISASCIRILSITGKRRVICYRVKEYIFFIKHVVMRADTIEQRLSFDFHAVYNTFAGFSKAIVSGHHNVSLERCVGMTIE